MGASVMPAMASALIHRGSSASSSCASATTSAISESRHGHAGVASALCSRERRPRGLSQNAGLSSSSRLLPLSRRLIAERCSSFSECQRCRRRDATICMVLPTGDVVADGQAMKSPGKSLWSARAIKSFSMSELEARKMKYPTTGTESLLMGVLTEGTSHASRYLRACGVTLFRVREETVNILGKADMYFFSPEHPPLTDQAKQALEWAKAESAKKGGDDEVSASYMVAGIWFQKGSAGQKVLEALGIDDQKMEDLLASEKKPVAV